LNGSSVNSGGGSQTQATVNYVLQTSATDFFRSVNTGNWNTIANWQSSPNGSTGWITATASPTSSAHTITIQTGNNITTNIAVAPASVVINSGGTLTLSGSVLFGSTAATSITVDGTLTCPSGVNSSSVGLAASAVTIDNGGAFTNNAGLASGVAITTFTVNSGGTYTHNATGTGSNGSNTDFPGTAGVGRVFGANSNVIITSWATTGSSPASLPTIASPGWGNLTLNYTTPTGSVNMTGALTAIQGNFIVTATGNNTTRSFSLSSTTTYTLNIGGSLTVNGGFLTFMSGGSGTGTINVAGDVNVSSGTLEYNASSGATANLNANGTVSGTTGSLNLSGGLITNLSTAVHTLTLAGDMLVSGGTYNMCGSGTATTVCTINVNGTVSPSTGKIALSGSGSITQGSSSSVLITTAGDITLANSSTANFQLTSSGSGSSGRAQILNIGGSLNVGSGTSFSASSTSSSTSQLNFTGGTASVTFTNAGSCTIGQNSVTVASGKTLMLNSDFPTTVASAGNMTVSGTLNCVAHNVTGTDNFILGAAGTLEIGSAVGITTSGATGSIQTSGATRTFPATAAYIYNGSGAQVTGSGLPASVANVTINNSGGSAVTLSKSTTITGTLTMTNGSLALSTFTLSYGAAGTLAYVSSSNQSTTNTEFPASGGPVNVIFNNSGTTGVTVNATKTITGNLSIPAGIATLGTGINMNVGTLTLGGLGRVNTTWGSTLSAAVNKTNTYFSSVAGSTGIVSPTTDARTTPTATLSVTNTPQNYTGSAQSAIVGITTSSVPGSVSSILTGGAATQINAGTYAVTASFVPTDGTSYKTLTGVSAGNFVINPISESIADYRSIINGNLSVLGTWQYNGGGTWLSATQIPGPGNNVLIQNTVLFDQAFTVGPNKTLTVTSGGTANFNGQSIRVQSTSAGTGAIGQTTGSITGATNVTVERYISTDNGSRAWRILSIPTYGSETVHASWQEGSVTPEDNLKPNYGTIITTDHAADFASGGFDALIATGAGGLIGGTSLQTFDVTNPIYWDDIATTFNPINGNIPVSNAISPTAASPDLYAIYVRGDRTVLPASSTTTSQPTTLETTGILYQGPLTVHLPAATFNMVGNPFASQIDFTKTTLANVNPNVFYIWDPKLSLSGSLGAYQTFDNLGTWTISPGGGNYSGYAGTTTIESGQAFLVTNTAPASTASVVFNESSKTTGNVDVFRPASPETTNYQLRTNLYEVAGTAISLADANLVVFNSLYSDSFNSNDALKLSNGGENFGLQLEGKILEIEARQPVSTTDTIFFDMWNMKQMQYQLQFAPTNLNIPGLTAYLLDSYQGTTTPIDLTNGSTASFTIDANAASSANNRFQIVFNNSNPVPVTFTSIQANQQNTSVNVDWQVAGESGIKQYVVERSTDGVNFTQVGTVPASGILSYSWTDASPVTGNDFYRVVSVGVSGDVKYSSTVKVLMGSSLQPGIAIYPNPVTGGRIGLQLTNLPAGNYGVRLLSIIGQELYRNTVNHPGGTSQQTLNAPTGLAQGIYKLEVLTPDNNTYTQKLIIK